MKRLDYYKECPEFTTKSFLLRLVKVEDAKDLLACYSDPLAVARINADKCTSDFYYATEAEMKECLSFWIDSYKHGYFLRLAIVPREGELEGHAVGTVEIFGGEVGVLRIDLATQFGKPEYIEEFIKLAIDRFVGPLQIGTLAIKVDNVKEWIPVVEKFGFVKSDFREHGYMEWQRTLHFKKELGVGVCGLACCLCSGNGACKGCKKAGCPERDWCKAYHCWQENENKNCSECTEQACEFVIKKKPKVMAMNQIISEFGKDKLLECLERNEKQGLNYHYLGEYDGDYDCATKEEAYELILNGWE